MGLAGPPAGSYYQPFAWFWRYQLDWYGCGPDIRRIRLYSTILRWFPTPAERHLQRIFSEDYLSNVIDPISTNHLANITDLLDSDVELGPRWSAQRMFHFLNSLRDGDLINGGPTPDTVHPALTATRPGYAYLLGKWERLFPEDPTPWPFWIFPRRGETTVDV